MSNGDGTFTGYVQQLGDTVFDTYGILSGDVNGDGKTDVIYWFHGGPGCRLRPCDQDGQRRRHLYRL